MSDAHATRSAGDRSSRPVWLGEDKRGWDHVRVHLQVVHDPRLDAYDLAVYLGLAAHAEVQSGMARPSMDTLAGYGGMSPRKVAGCIAHLAETGYVQVESRPGKASHYHLLPPPPLHEVQGSDRQEVGTSCRAPLHEVPTTPAHGADELEPVNENPGPEQTALAEGFDRFWKVYPRNTAKATARRAWPVAVKAAGSMATIVAGAERYRDDPNRVDRFTAHAATWLRAERWTDDPLPSRGRAPDLIDQDREGPSGRLDL